MTLWVESRTLEDAPTGVGRFIGNVLDQWNRETWPWPIVLLGRHAFAKPWSDRLRDHYKVENLPFHPRSYLAWQQMPVRRRLKSSLPSDLYLAPNYTVPFGIPCRRAVVIHDASFFHEPRWYRPKIRWLLRRLVHMACRVSEIVFVPTRFTRDEILHYVPGLDAQRVFVTYEGWDNGLTRPTEMDRSSWLKQYGIPQDAFVFLWVGALFQRRRLDLILDAFADPGLAAQKPHLVILGDNQTRPHLDYQQQVHFLGIEDRVHLLGYQPENVLRAFYQLADAVVYLSAYEGFGLPVLEGLAAGKPVLASDIPVFRELYSDAALLTPLDRDAVLEALHTLVKNPQPMEKAGSVTACLTWSNTAERIKSVLTGDTRTSAENL